MSTTTTSSALKRTPFYDFHVNQGAKMVEFAGWEMPMLYRSIIEEHRQVRRSGGFFDVSHMGRLRFTGRDAQRFLDHLCTRQIVGMDLYGLAQRVKQLERELGRLKQDDPPVVQFPAKTRS